MSILKKQLENIARKDDDTRTRKILPRKNMVNADIARIRKEHWIKELGAFSCELVDESKAAEYIGKGSGNAIWAITFKGDPL